MLDYRLIIIQDRAMNIRRDNDPQEVFDKHFAIEVPSMWCAVQHYHAIDSAYEFLMRFQPQRIDIGRISATIAKSRSF